MKPAKCPDCLGPLYPGHACPLAKAHNAGATVEELLDVALEGLDAPGTAIPAELLKLFDSITYAHEAIDGRVTCSGELLTVTVRMRAKLTPKAVKASTARDPATGLRTHPAALQCTCRRGGDPKPGPFHQRHCALYLPKATAAAIEASTTKAEWLDTLKASKASTELPTSERHDYLGQSFPKFRELAALLRQKAATLPECNTTKWEHNRSGNSDCRCIKSGAELPVIFQYGHFKLRCRPGRAHVEALAAHYEKPKVHARPDPKWDRAPAWLNVRRPAGADELLAQLEKELGGAS